MPTTKNAFAEWNAADFWRPWLQLAPTTLHQPLLTGWTFNINSNNSTAPQTEADVVAAHSYGRQLGRISEALRVLIHEQHGHAPESKELADFLTLCSEIDDVKNASAARRLQQIVADLGLLKRHDEAQYRRLRSALGQALKLTE